MRWRAGAVRKKDALESAQRDKQRVGPFIGFEHKATIALRCANWWAL